MPHLRGFELPKDKNAILYRGPWTVKEDYELDFSASDSKRDLVFMKSPEEDDETMSQEWIRATGAEKDTFLWGADLDFSRQHQKGLNVLAWEFGDIQRILYADLSSDVNGFDGGVLLGSRLSIDEIVERFVKNDAYEVERQFEEERNKIHKELRDEVRARYGNPIIRL